MQKQKEPARIWLGGDDKVADDNVHNKPTHHGSGSTVSETNHNSDIRSYRKDTLSLSWFHDIPTQCFSLFVKTTSKRYFKSKS